jgi:hypothetical protein
MNPHSRYGDWTTDDGLPVFVYNADHQDDPAAEWDTHAFGRTRRHFVGIGNLALQAYVDNDGAVALWDEREAQRWLVEPTSPGTGLSILRGPDGMTWGSRFDQRPPGLPPERVFGPTWFTVRAEHAGLKLERTVVCPEGERPWVLVRVRLVNTNSTPQRIGHREEWAVRPLFLNLPATPLPPAVSLDRARKAARDVVSYVVDVQADVVVAREQRTALTDSEAPDPQVIGSPHVLALRPLGEVSGSGGSDDAAHPTLHWEHELTIAAHGETTLWFKFGVCDDGPIDPEQLWVQSHQELAARLPSGASIHAPEVSRELPWHAALLTGGACRDHVLGGHTLNQASAYSMVLGFNGATRDPLQHALPLVYFQPELALSVLRNTLSWGRPNGWLPWCIDGAKRSRTGAALGPMQPLERASDLQLWALWLAGEYAAATGDILAFDQPLPFHGDNVAAPASLHAHLRSCFRYLVDIIGFGETGHLRVLDCDWADGHLGEIEALGLERSTVTEKGESVLNSAMAAWVLPMWAGLCERLGDHATGQEARDIAEGLRVAVAREWNGRWFRRARCGSVAVGERDLFLEVQPWAILCGAADDAQSADLLTEIDVHLRTGSPLGARERWPIPSDDVRSGAPGEALTGGIWPSLQTTLVWAAARTKPELAWDEWRRMTLAAHTSAYPDQWPGTLSGPDAYNAPESSRPGETWALTGFGMQAFPLNNLHVHAQPLMAYLRLLGIEPAKDGSLVVGGGDGSFASRTFGLRTDGSGWVEAVGDIRLTTPCGELVRGPGRHDWPGRV